MTDSIVIFEQWNSDDLGLPGASTNGQLQIIKPADTSKPIHQLFHADDGRSWKRRSVAGNDGAWKSWKKLFSQDEQPVLASDLYTSVGSNILSDPNFNDTSNNFSTYWSVIFPAVVDTTSSDLLALCSVRNIKVATVAPGTGIKQGASILSTSSTTNLYLNPNVSFYGYLNILGKAGTASEVDITISYLDANNSFIGATIRNLATQLIASSGSDQIFELPFNFTTPAGTVYAIFSVAVYAGGSTYGASSAYVSIARPRIFRIVPKAELINAVTSVNGATGDVNVPSGSGTSSGTNTGDETLATIKTKLGITTLSGSNTGDETNATILSKLGATAVTGSNTGDETSATIKSKLGITTLSGANTGDQTFSLTVPSIFISGGSSSSALSFTLANETQKTFLAGPLSGVAAAPTFRTIAASDLPSNVSITSNVLTTVDATANQALINIATTTGSTNVVEGYIIARDTATGNSATWKVQGLWKNVSGTLTAVGTPTLTSVAADAGASTWAVNAFVSSTNIRLRVTGAAATTIDWIFDGFVSTVS